MNFRDESNYHKTKVSYNKDNQGTQFGVSRGPVSISGFRGNGYKQNEASFDLYSNPYGSIQAYGGMDTNKNKSFGIKGSFEF